MGLFSKFFGNTAQPQTEVPGLGTFRRLKGTPGAVWTCLLEDLDIFVGGTDDAPDQQHLAFMQTIREKLKAMDAAINHQLLQVYDEAGLDIAFSHWSESFRLISVSVEKTATAELSWSITLEEQENLAHFDLYLEGDRFTGHSIDT